MIEREIASGSKFPAETVTLWKNPAAPGVYLFGQSDYIPLAKATISSTRKRQTLLYPQQRFSVEGTPVVAPSPRLRFFVNVPDLRCGVVKTGSEGFVGEVTRGIVGQSGWATLARLVKTIQDIPQQYVTEAALEPGRYAYLCFKKVGIRSVELPDESNAYLLEVKPS